MFFCIPIWRFIRLFFTLVITIVVCFRAYGRKLSNDKILYYSPRYNRQTSTFLYNIYVHYSTLWFNVFFFIYCMLNIYWCKLIYEFKRRFCSLFFITTINIWDISMEVCIFWQQWSLKYIKYYYFMLHSMLILSISISIKSLCLLQNIQWSKSSNWNRNYDVSLVFEIRTKTMT